jgi:hypothetical protein
MQHRKKQHGECEEIDPSQGYKVVAAQIPIGFFGHSHI